MYSAKDGTGLIVQKISSAIVFSRVGLNQGSVPLAAVTFPRAQTKGVDVLFVLTRNVGVSGDDYDSVQLLAHSQATDWSTDSWR